ncbi:MAG: trypsin-like peptidase domain-containing protein [Gammaproteobacteria bacterium]|nr:trypsin-like peptidase domain-containing protein [Gammaproteobacteria bacterium]
MINRFVAGCLLILGAGFCLSASAGNSEAQNLFETFNDRIYQIRVLEAGSGTKTSVGSGFAIAADGLLATNYHVVSDWVQHPKRYRLEYIDNTGKAGELRVVDVDVINDLALVQRDVTEQTYLELSSNIPQRGAEAYSLGNPRDLGMTVVHGTYSGFVERSFYRRILFSGAMNPGMSGGPTLDADGEVFGVNVATSGNGIGFLVPVDKLHALIKQYRSNPQTQDSLKTRIHAQLKNNQQRFMDILLDAKWPTIDVGRAKVIGEMAKFARCWGESTQAGADNNKELVSTVRSLCTHNEYIYLGRDFTTGGLEYEFTSVETDQLSSSQFYARYEGMIGSVNSVNKVKEGKVSNFSCHEAFVDNNVAIEAQQDAQKIAEEKAAKAHKKTSKKTAAVVSPIKPMIMRVSLCTRAYADFDDLYDVLFIGATVNHKKQGLVAHFTLAGVDKNLAMKFSKKFMENIQWK